MYIYIPFQSKLPPLFPLIYSTGFKRRTRACPCLQAFGIKERTERQTNMIFKVKLHNSGGDNYYGEQGTRLENDL